MKPKTKSKTALKSVIYNVLRTEKILAGKRVKQTLERLHDFLGVGIDVPPATMLS